MTPSSIVWFRLDLRWEDHPALQAALKHGGPVVPVFIRAPAEEAPWHPGAASRWWLHQSLHALDKGLRMMGSRLIIRRGSSLNELQALAKETQAQAVFWNRRYEPMVMARDAQVAAALQASGLMVESFNGALLNEPCTVKNRSGKPFQVFTPFWRSCLSLPAPPEPLPAPEKLPSPEKWPVGLPLNALDLEPEHSWAEGIRAAWQPGSTGAGAELKRFLKEGLQNYSEHRHYPGLKGTSRLSPHLHFGEITARQVWHAVQQYAKAHSIPEQIWRRWQFLTELGWREFAHHLLWHFPRTPEQPLRAEFGRFPWHENAQWLTAWQLGRTGYPLVDAGMRELWATGWMHNRVRMVVASFLVKNLLLPWQEGARWFWDTLVDADLANNTLGWQWTSGCGADAAPFFRIFNPVIQGEKFDPHGDYVRRWLPELARLPDPWIHKPWQAPDSVCTGAGFEMGRSYPKPIVSHTISREVALEAYARIKGRG
jgi:deoxyribodipyrimidine photo-lyase